MAWLDINWQYRIKFTVDNTKIDSNLSDFPTLVKLSVSNFDFSDAKSDGTDIRFTSSDGTTLLKFERERHDSINELAEYHVKVPSVVSATDTDFYMYFGNAVAADAEDATNVWDSDFLLVSHMIDVTTSTIENSKTGGTKNKGSANNPLEVVGEIYKSQDFSSDEINLGDIDIDGNGTLEAIVKPASYTGTFINTVVGRAPVGGGNPQQDMSMTLKASSGEVQMVVGDNANYQYFASTMVIPTISWNYIACKADGTNLSLVRNSTIETTPQTITPAGNSNPYKIGRMGDFSSNGYFDGKIDEVRMSAVARSDAWLKATRETLFDTLLTYQAKETLIEELEDIATDIHIKFPEYFEDVDIDIRVAKLIFNDIDTDIRVNFQEQFKDIDCDIRISKLIYEDLIFDIRVAKDIVRDINTDIRVAESVITDINTDIRISKQVFNDIDTDIRVIFRVQENQVSIKNAYFEEGAYLATNTVTIRMEEVFGAIKMQFKNEVGNWSTLESFVDNKTWNLTSGDGNKTVFLRFMDIVGNLSDGNDIIEATVNTIIPQQIVIEAYTDETAATPIIESMYQNNKKPFFRWKIPEFNIPYYAFSYALDGEPSEEVIDLNTGRLIRNGLEVVKVTPLPQMTVKAQSGFYYFESDLKNFVEQQITLEVGGVKDRIDVIYISGAYYSLNIQKGEESDTPVIPEIPEDGIELATAYVPAGTVDIVNVILSDIRQLHIELKEFLTRELSEGQHYLKVKSFNSNGLSMNNVTFNIWVSANSPTSGEIFCYATSSKLIQFNNGIYQTTDNTPYFEWVVAPAQPGPIKYYYTEDGTEPTLASSFTLNNYLDLGPYPNGITCIKIKAYDTVSFNWGSTKEFIFIYGTEVFTDDTVVISGHTILKQSLKEVQVKDISWDFDSARTCKILQPVEFDSNLPFSEGDIISVIYGGGNTTVFRGKVYKIERVIEEGSEQVLYDCVGPRGELAEEYAYIINPNFGTSAQIEFNDKVINEAINDIVGKFPNIVKNINNYPTGANITSQYIAQTVEQVLNDLYSKTKYGWYILPNGSLVSIDAAAINPGQAKFGVYGTTVNAISPQFNVMGANLQFDATKRYNSVIIEGAKKRVKVNLGASCGQKALEASGEVEDGTRANDAKFRVYKINSEWPVVKILHTTVAYSRIKAYSVEPIYATWGVLHIVKFRVIIIDSEICRQNKIYSTKREVLRRQTKSNLFTDGYIDTSYYGVPITSTYLESQGSLGPNNTIRFGKALFSYWPRGISRDTRFGFYSIPGRSIKTGPNAGAPAYVFEDYPRKFCATVSADCIIETVPLTVAVTVPGTASSMSKILRVVNNDFKYDEDPDNTVDDTARMIEYGQDLLQKYKDIKVSGTITLDTIDLSWDLDKTVNLINTGQAGWTTLNAKVTGISYNFDENTTTLEITSEFLK